MNDDVFADLPLDLEPIYGTPPLIMEYEPEGRQGIDAIDRGEGGN